MTPKQAAKKLAAAHWAGYPGQEWQGCEIGNLCIYRFPDGHASVAEGGTWIDALFISPEAAVTWVGGWADAERRFREVNRGMAPGRCIYLPARDGS